MSLDDIQIDDVYVQRMMDENKEELKLVEHEFLEKCRNTDYIGAMKIYNGLDRRFQQYFKKAYPHEVMFAISGSSTHKQRKKV